MNDDELKKKAAELMSDYASRKKETEDANDAFEDDARRLQSRVPALLSEWETALSKCIDAMNAEAVNKGVHNKFEPRISRASKQTNFNGAMGFRFDEYEFVLSYSFAASSLGFEVCSGLDSHVKLRGSDITARVKSKYRLTPEFQAGKAVFTTTVSGERIAVDPFDFWLKEAQKALQ